MTQRTFTVAQAEAGQTLADWLQQRLTLPRDQVRQLVRSRQVRVAGIPCLDLDRRVRPGQLVDVRLLQHSGPRPERSRPGSPADFLDALPTPPVLRFVDEAVAVVDKPSGLTTMRHPEDVEEQGPRAAAFCRRPWPTWCRSCWPAGPEGSGRPSGQCIGWTRRPPGW